jgi:hypothetical protein
MEQRYSSTLSLTATLDWFGWSTPHPGLSRERDPALMAQEAVWNSEPVWKGARKIATTWIRSPNRPAHNESQYRLRYIFYKRVLRPDYCLLRCDVVQSDVCRTFLIKRLPRLSRYAGTTSLNWQWRHIWNGCSYLLRYTALVTRIMSQIWNLQTWHKKYLTINW